MLLNTLNIRVNRVFYVSVQQPFGVQGLDAHAKYMERCTLSKLHALNKLKRHFILFVIVISSVIEHFSLTFHAFSQLYVSYFIQQTHFLIGHFICLRHFLFEMRKLNIIHQMKRL